MHYIPALCNHCDKPSCADACKFGAIAKREDGLVLHRAREVHRLQGLPGRLPLRRHLLQRRSQPGAEVHRLRPPARQRLQAPRCVEACPTDAIQFGEEAELAGAIAGATVLQPETGNRPRVYYRNIPGKFIAGTLYDPVEKEVVIGARCRLSSGGKLMETTTDVYGDFWFNDLAVGTYDVAIEAEGFESMYFAGLDTSKSLNLGDIALARK